MLPIEPHHMGEAHIGQRNIRRIHRYLRRHRIRYSEAPKTIIVGEHTAVFLKLLYRHQNSILRDGLGARSFRELFLGHLNLLSIFSATSFAAAVNPCCLPTSLAAHWPVWNLFSSSTPRANRRKDCSNSYKVRNRVADGNMRMPFCGFLRPKVAFI